MCIRHARSITVEPTDSQHLPISPPLIKLERLALPYPQREPHSALAFQRALCVSDCQLHQLGHAVLDSCSIWVSVTFCVSSVAVKHPTSKPLPERHQRGVSLSLQPTVCNAFQVGCCDAFSHPCRRCFARSV